MAIEEPFPHLTIVESGGAVPKTAQWNRGAFVLETTAEGEAVRILGEIDMANAADFENCIARAASMTGSVVVDLNQCTYFDSSALSVLARMNRLFGEELRVVAPSGGFAERLFLLTHFTRLLNVTFETADEIRERARRDTGFPQQRPLH